MTTTISHTFTAGTKARASQVNTNLSQLLAGLNALEVMTTRGDIIYRNATIPARLALGTAGKVLRSDGTDPTWAWPEVLVAKSADYTILDNDGYKIIYVTTGASTITITLPTAADNTNREITIKKADSGAGKIVIDGEGTETIEGALTREIGNGASNQYRWITLLCTGTAWIVTGINGDQLTAAGSSTNMTTAQYADGGNAGLSLAPGTWEIQASVVFVFGATSSWTQLYAAIGTASGNNGTGTSDTANAVSIASAANVPTATPSTVLVTPVYRVTITAATTYYPKNFSRFTSTAIAGQNTIFATLVG